MAVVIQSYRFALDPSPAQAEALRSHCGAQRFAYNWGLDLIKAVMDQRAAEASYGIADEKLTPPLSWSAYSLRKVWNSVKDDVAPWWGENSKEAYASGLANLATGLKNWRDSRREQRKGARVGFPKRKSRRHMMSCRFTTGSFGLPDHDRRHIKLPRIGLVRTHESTRKLARHIERGTARIRAATASFRSGRWFVSFSVEIDRHEPTPRDPHGAVGVDLGIKSLAVLSTGDVIPNPRHLELALKELRRLQRQASRRAGPDTGRMPSTRWIKTQTRIEKLHARVAQARLDGLHKLTTRLIRQYGVIIVEDLNVQGMMSNRSLARHVAGVGLSEFRRQVEYKAAWSDVRVIIADRWFASSKTCSGCGVVKAKLRLSERLFHCQVCGLDIDRDLNAARNLAALAERETSSASCAARLNEPDGNPRKTITGGHGYRHGKAPAHTGRGQRQRGNTLTQ